LTKDGIFERLESDIQFRSVATALVQQYRYLLPKLNPDSDQGKEHELSGCGFRAFARREDLENLIFMLDLRVILMTIVSGLINRHAC
jgi:hypothetical protein